jgi:hypothetical protein
MPGLRPVTDGRRRPMRLLPHGSAGTHEVSGLDQMGLRGWRDPAQPARLLAKGCEFVRSCGPGQAPEATRRSRRRARSCLRRPESARVRGQSRAVVAGLVGLRPGLYNGGAARVAHRSRGPVVTVVHAGQRGASATAPSAEMADLRGATWATDSAISHAESAGVTWPGVSPTNPSPTVTVRGLPGRLALAKPGGLGAVGGFVPYAPA